MTLPSFESQLQEQAAYAAAAASGQTDRRGLVTLHLRGGQSFTGRVLAFDDTPGRGSNTRYLQLSLFGSGAAGGETLQIALDHISALSIQPSRDGPQAPNAAAWTKLRLNQHAAQLAERLRTDQGVALQYKVENPQSDGAPTDWGLLAERLDLLHGALWAIAGSELGREALAEKVREAVLQASAAEQDATYAQGRLLWRTPLNGAGWGAQELRSALEAVL